MTRTRAEALALVNWKGVFYERYLLDRHVTALEGANGAGKTTVMIGAYVVLLPDMSRLRFTNLGETGATGGDKGIWGRLGEPGRPSYAVLDFEVAGGERLVAGVQLVRKGEPSVEPTPFIVTGLAEDVGLQDLLLLRRGEIELVPELPELRENAALLGGRLQSFGSARDYFRALFDAGVTPMRLETDEERNKFNEMLRTSMTGGISRALTSELRSFLLKEESGLAGTLQQMRANLDACRRTRTEVQESQKLEEEIGGVLDAGHAMFAAAFRATRERARELEERVEQTERERAAALDEVKAVTVALDAIESELASLTARRTDLEEKRNASIELQRSLKDALKVAKERTEYEEKHREAAEAEREAEKAKNEAEVLRDRRLDELRRAQENLRIAAAGLADFNDGLTELHRRADAHRRAKDRLAEAQRALGGDVITPAQIESRLDDARDRRAAVDQQRRELRRRVDDAHAHRRRHAEASEALEALTQGTSDASDAYAAAVEALHRHRDAIALSERLPAIESAHHEARELTRRQNAARTRAEALGVTLHERAAAEVVAELLHAAESERSRLLDEERAAREVVAEARRTLTELERQAKELNDREPRWIEIDARARRLSDHLTAPVTDEASLDSARSTLAGTLHEVRQTLQHLEADRDRLRRESRELSSTGGAFPPELLRLRDELDAELVASQFEDLPPERAGWMEARLGPLTQALAVDDPHAAARAAAARGASLPQLWLVPRDANLDDLDEDGWRSKSETEPDSADVDIRVSEGPALRVTRIPARPRLGRRAREQRAAELLAEAEALEIPIDEKRRERGRLERLVADGDALLGERTLWLSGDPRPELERVRRSLDDARKRRDEHERAANEAQASALALRPRIDGLRQLLGEALLLDPPDHAARTASLEAELQSAKQAQAEVKRSATAAMRLEQRLGDLRHAPLSEDDLSRLGGELDALDHQRDELDGAVEALEYVRTHIEALDWTEAQARLDEGQKLVPALKAQHQEARLADERAEDARRAADEHFGEADEAWRSAHGNAVLALERLQDAVARFEAIGIPDPTPEALEAAQGDERALIARLRELDERRDTLNNSRGETTTRLSGLQRRASELDEQLSKLRNEAEPAQARWERLLQSVKEHRLLAGDLLAEDDALRGHPNLVQEAQNQRAILKERLGRAAGGEAVVTELRPHWDPPHGAFTEASLLLWLTVRDWLRRRLPAQVAEVDDPREGLHRLRDQLRTLEERLNMQEAVLRGASEDVARGIDTQIRRAHTQIARLNGNLKGVRFGSIEGIRVRLGRVERMEQVLRALRSGEAQSLLFQKDMPIEDALEEIFRRHAGGQRGGNKLLDYREYLHLQVEIRRKTGADWEIANPTRVSTGEAIGIGAALMMVVLTEWELGSNLLRGKRTHGSLRFLFLDEANRLSHDNLGVLFELCRTLDLQLLIAAPEVATAEGNTTYRLVRVPTADGREEVKVSGRRTRAIA